jgi:hypothetical protein
MSRTRLEYLVEIATKGTLTDPTIGAVNGVLTLTDSEFSPILLNPAKSGILATNWITPYGSSANTTQSGDIAQYTQWELRLTAKPNILTRIEGIIGSDVAVSVWDGTTPRTIRGVIINAIDKQTEAVLVCSPPSKFRECPVGTAILGSGVVALQEVSEDDIILEIAGATAGFYCRFANLNNYSAVNLWSLRNDYAYPTDVNATIAYINQKIADGWSSSIGNFAVTITSIAGHSVGSGIGGVFMECSFRNIGDDRETLEDNVVVVTLSKKRYVADSTSGAIIASENTYSDGLTITDSEVIVNGDPIIFKRILPQSYEELRYKPSWLYPSMPITDGDSDPLAVGWWRNGGALNNAIYTKSGDIADIFGNDQSQAYNVSAVPQNTFTEMIHIIKVSFPPFKTKPSKLYLCMEIIANANVAVDNFKPTFYVDWKYGRQQIEYDNTPMSRNYWIITNDIPILSGMSAEAERDFRWGTNNTAPTIFNGLVLEIGSLPTEDYMFQAGIDVYVSLYSTNGSLPSGLATVVLDYSYRSFSLVSEESFDSSGVEYVSGSLSNQIKYSYLKALQLQNWTDRGANVALPALGWGKELAVIDSGEYQDDTNYGGIESIDTTIFGQFSEGSTTADIKQDICRSVFGLSTVSEDGIEHLYDITEGLRHTEGEIYTLADITDGKRYSVSPYPIENMWTGVSIEWGSNKNKIEIGNTEQISFDASYVAGITDAGKASELWGRFKQVWETVHQKQILKKAVVLVDSESSAIKYIEGVLNLLGCYENTVYSRYKLSFQTSYYRGIALELGQKIRFSYPATGFVHSGYIESVSKDIIGGKCSITAQMLGYEIGGYDTIIEGVVGADTIIEGEILVTKIIEGF